MKRILMLLISLSLMFCVSACSADTSSESGSTAEPAISSTSSAQTDNNGGNSQTNSNASTSSENNSETTVPDTESGSKILVAFFSRADENYGVGYIEKGNTHIIADVISDEMNADMFEIVRVTPYPAAYNDCTEEAKREQNENARPELTASVSDFDDYDVIFLGYPNWWGDMPMPVYTFLESYDFSGKTVIPFCTHAGSGLSGTVGTLRNKLSGSTVLDGLAIAGTTAQNDQDKAKQDVLSWLDEIDLFAQ